MALTAITEMGNRSGGLRMEGLQRTYKRTYQVFTSGAAVEPLEIMTGTTAGGVRLPRIGESYIGANGYYDTGAIVDDFEIHQPNDDHPDYWIVTVIWRSFPSNLTINTQGGGGGSPGSPQTSNPLFEPVRVNWGTRKKFKGVLLTTPRPDITQSVDTVHNLKIVFALDAANNEIPAPIANTAGSIYNPAPAKEISYRTLTITRNEPEFRPFTSDLYVGSVNSKLFQGQDPGCVLCDDIDAEYGYRDGIYFFTVTYRFSIAPLRSDGTMDPYFWYQNLLNTGPKYRDDANKLQDYKSPIGVLAKDAYLDYDGKLLPGFDKDTGILDSSAKPITLVFPDRDANDFDELALPDPAYL